MLTLREGKRKNKPITKKNILTSYKNLFPQLINYTKGIKI
jgi:hypothetical protein